MKRTLYWLGVGFFCFWAGISWADPLFRAFDLTVPAALPTRIIATAAGEVWFVMTNGNRLGKWVPGEARVTEYEIPSKQSRPTDLIMDGAGAIWFIEQDANQLGKLDPKTGVFQEFDIPTFSSLPFQMVWDGQQGIWFTEHYSNQLGRFDMLTATFKEFPIPTPDSRPSGITIDRHGIVWFLETSGNKVASMNPKDGRFEIQEYALPTQFSVPRDLVSDGVDTLWFGARSRQELLSFDINQNTFTSYPIPGGGVIEGLAVAGEGRLLYTLGQTGKMGMFDTAKKVFVAFDTMLNNSRPNGVGVDVKGNIWYTDIANNVLVQGNGEAVSQLINR